MPTWFRISLDESKLNNRIIVGGQYFLAFSSIDVPQFQFAVFATCDYQTGPDLGPHHRPDPVSIGNDPFQTNHFHDTVLRYLHLTSTLRTIFHMERDDSVSDILADTSFVLVEFRTIPITDCLFIGRLNMTSARL